MDVFILMQNEKIEVEVFLNAVLSKPPFTTLHPWLVQKGGTEKK